ncbi:MAG: molybdenum cofactor biosynthesis protein MoaE [Gemmatimonadota bacterium]|nr:MAG: molybdenum cofactor biosynthesis protein MoaE [Gemmatimonadota bacterium]
MQYLVDAAIDVAQLIDMVSSDERGGTAAFIGSVRRGPDDGPVVGIEYSAYEAMVETQLDKIIARAAERWPQARVEVRHRIGRVATREASVAVVVGAPHRAEAFAACRYVVEQLKQRVPIWKREILETGERRWRTGDLSPEEHP